MGAECGGSAEHVTVSLCYVLFIMTLDDSHESIYLLLALASDSSFRSIVQTHNPKA